MQQVDTRAIEQIYMSTASGMKVFPFAMTPDQVDIITIGRHLACQSRWLGATRHKIFQNRISYSVAEHSVYVSDFVKNTLRRPDLAFDALMHDAAEAYIGDMIRPLKYSATFFEPFKALEEKVERVIATRFGMDFPFNSVIKVADDAVCQAEWEQIVPVFQGETRQNVDMMHSTAITAPVEIAMLPPFEAYELFMDRFHGFMTAGLFHGRD